MVTIRMKEHLAAGILSAVGVLLLSSTGYGYQYLTVSGIVVTECSAQFGPPDLTDGLLAYWPMEDGYGSTVTDWSGNGNHGTFDIPTLPIWQPAAGHIEGALLFDGQGGHLICPASPPLDFVTGLTVMAWIKTDSLTKDWQAIVTKGDSAWRLHRYLNTDYIDFACTGLTGGNNTWGSSVWGSKPVVDNE